MKFLLFSTLFSVAFSQVLLPLNSFKGGSYNNVLPGTGPYAVYVSAHSDATSALQSIFVVSGDGTRKSLNDLKNNKLFQNSGELQPYVITDSATVTTTLTTNDMQRLNGVMFVSSKSQLNNTNFHVIDISTAQTIPKSTQVELTILFLNTHMGTNPYKSSLISSWNQDSHTQAYIWPGVPTDFVEDEKRYIFSNPMLSRNFNQYIPNVEKFSFTLNAFYMKTLRGCPGFRIEPGSYYIDGTTTTAVTTTGFYMKAKGQADQLVKIHTKRDSRYSGASGANMLGSLPTTKLVTVGIYDGASKYEDTSAPNPFFTPWAVPAIGENIQISSTGGVDGEYYVQYFVMQGPVGTGTTLLPGRQTTARPGAPTNAPGPTVPGHVETTTKSSSTYQFLTALMISLGFIGFI